jgi:hypothetical protein
MMSRSTLTISLPFQPNDSAFGECRVLVVVVLDAAVAVLVLELQQAGGLPVLEPLGTLFVGRLPSAPTGPIWMVSIRFRRAMAPTAGAVVYSSAMNTSAQPAE